MGETVFEELKRYIDFSEEDERALRALHPLLAPDFEVIASTFYQRILDNPDARRVLEGGESQVGRLKVTLIAWMDRLLRGPWDQDYFELRCRIGRVHVRIALPQHYMFGAMNVVRREMNARVDGAYAQDAATLSRARAALGKILDLELAIMLHTYREDLVDQQERAARLSTFGQLVGSIGHELRNPLGVMETSLYILQSRLGEDARAAKHLQRIGEQLQIANAIITSLLDMIRDRPLVREPLALEEVVRAAAGSIAHPGVELFLEGLEGAQVRGDAAQLRQVFVNLIENAVFAASPEGKVWVRREPGEVLTVSVEDSGKGLDASVRARLFEPLVTTKAKGIGLGLALVKRMVERHGGAIRYAPREGHGARFVIELPGGPA